jgi:hypothetical protein
VIGLAVAFVAGAGVASVWWAFVIYAHDGRHERRSMLDGSAGDGTSRR